MTYSNGTRWDHNVDQPFGGGPTIEQTSLADELIRLDDGRWTPMMRIEPTVDPVAAPPPRPHDRTTQLAAAGHRDTSGVWGIDPELESELDDAWAAHAGYDQAFEEASTRFFDTDPGNRLTYAHLLDAEDQPVMTATDPEMTYPVPAVTSDAHIDDADVPLDEDALVSGAAARRNAIEWAVVLVAAVLLALVLRAIALQAFYIPSPSMEDTLAVQDRVLVNKLSYQFGGVNRGDIVVFHRTDEEIAVAGPNQPRDVIKRVIALGGETIEISNNSVYINGQQLVEPYLDPNLVMADFGPITVPEGTLFVMGDNRNLSSDSRGELGPIDEERIVGRAFVLFWPLDRIGRL
ncbi:MAG: signal peptidase I [Acidimicrobiia bacterium]|nr:signal peptidase I [Acidimicrobiia bacterium]